MRFESALVRITMGFAFCCALAAGDSLAFYAPPSVVDEGGGGVDVMVIRMGSGIGAVSVDVAAGGGLSGATLGVDFQAASPALLTWADGDRTYRIVHVSVLHNPAYAPAHSLALSLANPSGGAVLDPDMSLIHIPIAEVDQNPSGTLSVITPDATQSISVRDDAGALTVQMVRKNGSSGAVVATLSLVDLSAVMGVDFTAPADPTLAWADGETGMKSLQIPILPRSQAKGPLRFSLSMYPTSGSASIRISGANVTITDHLPITAGTLSCPTLVTVGELAGTATLLLSRHGGNTGQVSVDWTSHPSTALDGVNFTASSGTLVWNDGDTAAKPIIVPIIADGVSSSTLYAYVTFANPTGGVVLPPDLGASLAITDQDGVAGCLGFSTESIDVSELDGQAVVAVSRRGGSTGAVSVDWSSRDGSAVSGMHYTGSSGTLIWSDGDAADKLLTFPVVHDGALGSARYFYVDLSNLTGGAALDMDYSSDGSEVSVVIHDADGNAGRIAWVSDAVSVGESSGTVSVTATRTAGSAGPVSVPISLRDNGARQGLDYGVADRTTLVWADGEAGTKSLSIPILNDGKPGVDHDFQVQLGPASGGAAVDMPVLATVTIQEADHAVGTDSPGPCGSGAAGVLVGLGGLALVLRARGREQRRL